MSRTGRFAGLVLALVGVVTPALAEGDIEVRIREPLEGQPALGEVVVHADVLSAEAVAVVEFWLDGRLVTTLDQPPYRAVVDLGTESRGHEIEVVARSAVGGAGRSRVATAAIPDSGNFQISLQQLYVTVTRGEERMTGLDREAFEVLDRGTAQSIVTFERGDIPFTAVLLVDASSSMVGQRLAAAAAGVEGFMADLADLDRSALLVFSDRLLGRTSFEVSPGEVRDLVATTVAGGGSSIHDHLYLAVKLLERQQGRRVVVLLSDGIDSHSVLGIDQVTHTIRASQALVYWLWLAPPNSVEFDGDRLRTVRSTWFDSHTHQRRFDRLRSAVEASGGRIIRVADDREIETAYTALVRELRDQYALGYYPSDDSGDGSWHPVEVEVAGFGLEARTHAGYFDAD